MNAVLPELTVALSAVVVLMAGLDLRLRRYVWHISIAGIIAAMLFLSMQSGQGMPDSVEIAGGVSFEYTNNLFSSVFKALFLFVGLIAVAASRGTLSKEESHPEVYYSLMLFAVLGMMVVASASDLITLFLGIELAAIPGFILVAFDKRKLGLEGAIKYFVFGAFFSVIMLLGMAFIYAGSGSFMLKDISGGESGANIVLFFGTLLLLAGFGFEMAAVPFHFWAPDAYSGAPSPVAGLLAGASKKMAFAAAIKVLAVSVVLFKMEMTLVIAPLAVLSMVLGNVVALSQKDIRRMLAYSSIAHVGYMLAGIALMTQPGVAASVYHIIVHAFMKGGAFIAAWAVAVMIGATKLEEYRGLAKRAPVIAFCMLVFLLSLAGLVPFGGFTSKILILAASFNEAMSGSSISSIAFILGVTLIATSLLSLYYYFRVIKLMYFTEPEKGKEGRVCEPLVFVAPVTAAAAMTLILFYAPPFIDLCTKIAAGLGF